MRTHELPGTTTVLRDLLTEDALALLEEHGVIKDVSRRGGGNTGVLAGYSFINTATRERVDGPTQTVRRYALGLQQNLNIVLEKAAPIRTESGPRVFFPGDELPKGIYVMARSGSVSKVEYERTKVRPEQPDPLVEVVLPDFERLVRHAWVQKQARAERLGPS